jgi:cytochrome c-type biogenesis protein CcmH/NrfF
MRALLVALGAVVLFATPAVAAPEDVANRLSNEIMSPFCPGVTLHDCPSAEADALRERIRNWSADGWSEDQIMSELTAEYGPGINAVPPNDVGGLAPWMLPALVAGGGLFFTGALARRWTKAREEERRREDIENARSLRTTPEQRSRLEAELAAHRAAGSAGSSL